MAFAIFLLPTTASPPSAQFEVEVQRAIAAEGGELTSDGDTGRSAEGTRFALETDGLFGADQLSPGLCRIIFRAALDTNSVIERAGADAIPLRVKGVKGELAGFPVRADTIASPHDLCGRLGRDLIAWNRFVRAEQAEGRMDRNQEPLEPPAAPGTEARLSTDTSGVGARCVATANPPTRKPPWTIERTTLSQNPNYGVVWRADVVTPKYPDVPSRLICWKAPHSEKIMFEVRPLQMFDPTQSVGPLQTEPAPNGGR